MCACTGSHFAVRFDESALPCARDYRIYLTIERLELLLSILYGLVYSYTHSSWIIRVGEGLLYVNAKPSFYRIYKRFTEIWYFTFRIVFFIEILCKLDVIITIEVQPISKYACVFYFGYSGDACVRCTDWQTINTVACIALNLLWFPCHVSILTDLCILNRTLFDMFWKDCQLAVNGNRTNAQNLIWIHQMMCGECNFWTS